MFNSMETQVTGVRLPKELRAEIEKEADEYDRTMSAVIVERLRDRDELEPELHRALRKIKELETSLEAVAADRANVLKQRDDAIVALSGGPVTEIIKRFLELRAAKDNGAPDVPSARVNFL